MKANIKVNSKILSISIMLYRWKNKNFKMLTIVPLLFAVISAVLSMSSSNQDILYPFSSLNINLTAIIIIILPLAIIFVFYDLISFLNESGIMKKILSEPVSTSEIFLSSLLFMFFYVIIISISLVVPGFIVSFLISRYKSLDEEFRFLAILFPTIIYGVFYSLIALLYSARSKSSFKALGLSIITLIIISYLLSPLINIYSDSICQIFHITPSSLEGQDLIGFINAIIPGQSVSRSISVLADPQILMYNLYPGTLGTFVYSSNGEVASFGTAMYYSTVAIIPVIIYDILLLILFCLGVKKIPKLF